MSVSVLSSSSPTLVLQDEGTVWRQQEEAVRLQLYDRYAAAAAAATAAAAYCLSARQAARWRCSWMNRPAASTCPPGVSCGTSSSESAAPLALFPAHPDALF